MTRNKLTLYKKYIDDLIIVWNGNRDTLEQFLSKLNDNKKNINLVWKIDKKSVDFLDFNVSLEGDKVVTKTFFKEWTNSYLLINSCNFKPWLYNIPKGQLTRIKRNHTRGEDQLIQAEQIGARFKAKGYDNHWIEKQIQHVSEMNRTELLQKSSVSDIGLQYTAQKGSKTGSTTLAHP